MWACTLNEMASMEKVMSETVVIVCGDKQFSVSVLSRAHHILFSGGRVHEPGKSGCRKKLSTKRLQIYGNVDNVFPCFMDFTGHLKGIVISTMPNPL